MEDVTEIRDVNMIVVDTFDDINKFGHSCEGSCDSNRCMLIHHSEYNSIETVRKCASKTPRPHIGTGITSNSRRHSSEFVCQDLG